MDDDVFEGEDSAFNNAGYHFLGVDAVVFIDQVRKDLFFGSNSEDCSYVLADVLGDMEKEYQELLVGYSDTADPNNLDE